MNTNDNAPSCAAARDQFADWLSNELSPADRTALDAHLAHCPACQRELAAFQRVWQGLGQVPTPEPGPQVQTRFYAMLDEMVEAEKTRQLSGWKGFFEKLNRAATPAWASRLAYSLLLLGLGVGAGYWIQERKTPDVAYQRQIDALSAQVEDMRQTMMLSLLENPSATERLRAVGFTKEINGVDGKVIDALLTTLNNDPNVNVRLVTLEALADLARDARVREGLVQSLTRQESPLVQVALADVMVRLQEKRSLKPLRQMLRQPGINDLVKSKLEQTIKELS
mgnify:CR=1 FL=1